MDALGWFCCGSVSIRAIGVRRRLYVQDNNKEKECFTKNWYLSRLIHIFELLKILEIHKGEAQKNCNYGNLLKNPFLENGSENEIIILLKIEEEELNKDVYILNYP